MYITKIVMLIYFCIKNYIWSTISCGRTWDVLWVSRVDHYFYFITISILAMHLCLNTKYKMAEVYWESFQSLSSFQIKKLLNDFLKNETKSAIQIVIFKTKHSITTQSTDMLIWNLNAEELQRQMKSLFSPITPLYFHRSGQLSVHSKRFPK